MDILFIIVNQPDLKVIPPLKVEIYVDAAGDIVAIW
jgi:hypothetical protein